MVFFRKAVVNLNSGVICYKYRIYLSSMSQPMQKCDNCLKEFPESKIATHFGYCRRNIKKCADCGEMYDINCQEQHEQQFHKKLACQFCKKQYGVAQLQKHKNGCSQRTKYCQYCELNVPFNEYTSHLKACQSRTKGCDKCKKPIANKDYLIHLTTCKGITEQPRSYNDYLNNQRAKDNREEARQQYARLQQKKQEQYKRQGDMRRRQVPSSTPVYNPAPKPTVTPIQPASSNVRQQQYTNQPTSSHNVRQPVTNPTVVPTYPSSSSNSNSNNVRYGVSNNVNTYNPREINSGQQQHREIRREPAREPVREPVREVREQAREPVREQYGKYAGGYGVGQQPTSIRTEIRTDNRVYQQKRDQNMYQRQPQRIQIPSSKPSYTSSTSNQQKYEAPRGNIPSSSSSNQLKKEAPKKTPTFDPSEYGGYSNEIPQQFLRNDRNTNNFGINDEDEEFQRVLIESMNNQNQHQKKKNVPTQDFKNMPKDFSSQQLMKSSMVLDLDMERQKAAYEEMERNARKNKR